MDVIRKETFRALVGVMVLLAMSAVALAAAGLGAFRVQPRGSEEKIRAAVLTHTPLGMPRQEVLLFIQRRLVHEGEVEVSNSGARRVTHGPNGVDEWIGVSGINRIEVGHYGEWRYLLLIETYVYLSWAFDADERLIDVIVYKETDSL